MNKLENMTKEELIKELEKNSVQNVEQNNNKVFNINVAQEALIIPININNNETKEFEVTSSKQKIFAIKDVFKKYGAPIEFSATREEIKKAFEIIEEKKSKEELADFILDFFKAIIDNEELLLLLLSSEDIDASLKIIEYILSNLK